MHRNTFLLVSILAVFAALVVGVNLGRRFPNQQLTIDNQQVLPTSSPTPSPRLIGYTSQACGVSLQYPERLQILESTGSGAILINPNNPDESVMLACQADIPRPALASEKIETITLEATSGTSFSAKLYHDANARDGTPVDKLIFTHPKTGLDVFVAGFGAAYQQLISSLKLL